MFMSLRKYATYFSMSKEERSGINVKLEAKDFEKSANMKSVFLSASPVLVNEVSRFYQTLKDSLVKFLREKEAREEEKKQEFEDLSKEEVKD